MVASRTGNTVTTVADHTAHVIPRLPALGFGGDWNPEQWPSSVWDEDLRLMRQAHVNLVTLGVFSWAYLEPTPGQYEFGWLDTVLDKCLDAGVAVDLATATASPPPWLGHRWPESLPVTDDGVRLVYGARQQYCPSSAPFRDRALALTERMASRYADHDAVVMWHVGNEYGAHTPACWCDISAEAFRDWLAKRYDTLDELNAAWSTAFWSQRFSDWSEVIPPRRTPYFPNPTHQLDFKRFSSDALLGLFLAERDIIRSPLARRQADHHQLHAVLPACGLLGLGPSRGRRQRRLVPRPRRPALPRRGRSGRRPHALARRRPAVAADGAGGLGHQLAQPSTRRSPAVRTAAGHCSRWPAAPTPSCTSSGGPPQAVPRSGTPAMLPHAGPRTRTWHEVEALGRRARRRCRRVAGARTPADVAIVLDWSSWWALELDSRPSTLLSMMAILRTWYEPLWRRGYAIDFAHPESDLTGYALVVVPQLYSVTDLGAPRIVEAAEPAAASRSATSPAPSTSATACAPAATRRPGRSSSGIWIEEYRPLLPGDSVAISSADPGLPQASTATAWSEHVHLTTAQAVMSYVGDDIDEAPRSPGTRLPGGGQAWYVSTALQPDAMAALVLQHRRRLRGEARAGRATARRTSRSPSGTRPTSGSCSSSTTGTPSRPSTCPRPGTRHGCMPPAGSRPAGRSRSAAATSSSWSRGERTPDS